MAANALFKPYSKGNLSLTNRIVMAPMTRQFSPNGVPTNDVAGYYKRRAQGGTGLIITEGTTVNDKVATMDANIPQFHSFRNRLDRTHKPMPTILVAVIARTLRFGFGFGSGRVE